MQTLYILIPHILKPYGGKIIPSYTKLVKDQQYDHPLKSRIHKIFLLPRRQTSLTSKKAKNKPETNPYDDLSFEILNLYNLELNDKFNFPIITNNPHIQTYFNSHNYTNVKLNKDLDIPNWLYNYINSDNLDETPIENNKSVEILTTKSKHSHLPRQTPYTLNIFLPPIYNPDNKPTSTLTYQKSSTTSIHKPHLPKNNKLPWEFLLTTILNKYKVYLEDKTAITITTNNYQIFNYFKRQKYISKFDNTSKFENPTTK